MPANVPEDWIISPAGICYLDLVRRDVHGCFAMDEMAKDLWKTGRTAIITSTRRCFDRNACMIRGQLGTLLPHLHERCMNAILIGGIGRLF